MAKNALYSISEADRIAADLIRHLTPLQTPLDLDALIDRVGSSRVVMLGEASHGTHEYYTWRALLSQRLIEEKGFSFIAVEGDWPDCYRLNRYARNYAGAGTSAVEVLGAFNRWPTWMWGNWETVAFTEWLCEHNRSLAVNQKAGFYGLDLYSLWESLEAIRMYLRKTDPSALPVAERAFECLAPFERDEGRGYSYTSLMVPEPCTNEVITLLSEMRRRVPRYDADAENVFSLEQNALIAVNAEKYYRAMLQGGAMTWNIRDGHMMETLNRLMQFYGPGAKGIVWAHNSHIGDARATTMHDEGMLNLGELGRKFYGREYVSLVGFGSYEGTVVASPSWGAPLQRMMLPPAREGSWEDVLNRTGTQNGYLFTEEMKEGRMPEFKVGHRAVGVVYNPQAEKWGNYVPTVIPERYDAFVFLKLTKGLHPLNIPSDEHQAPETYPFGV